MTKGKKRFFRIKLKKNWRLNRSNGTMPVRARGVCRSALEDYGRRLKCSEAPAPRRPLSQLRSGLRPDVVVMDFGLSPGLERNWIAIGLISRAEQRQTFPVLDSSVCSRKKKKEKLPCALSNKGGGGLHLFFSRNPFFSPNSEVVNGGACCWPKGKQYVFTPVWPRRLNGDHGQSTSRPRAHEATFPRVKFETITPDSRWASRFKEIAEALKNFSKATASTYSSRTL